MKNFERRDVEFSGGDGVTLRGWLFVPEITEGRLPAVSMCHGFAAVKEHALERFAQTFAEAGFVVLVHDHRSFGSSDGTPRHDIDPWVQIADWRRALTFLELQREVDPQRIGIWGSSFSGGHALVMGATDARVKCVVSQVPTISGFEQSRRRISPDLLSQHVERQLEDLRLGHAGAGPGMQAVASKDLAVAAAYRADDAVAFYTRDLGQANWANQVTVRSSFAASMYEPGIFISRISPRPLLMIVALNDRVTITDLELKAYEDALEPKRLVTISGGHFEPYDGAFSTASRAATDWFLLHLG